MSFFSCSGGVRGLCVVLAIALLLAVCTPQAQAASPVPSPTASSTTLFAGLGDYVMGNRSRIIQVAFGAFALGILILVTATRKH